MEIAMETSIVGNFNKIPKLKLYESSQRKFGTSIKTTNTIETSKWEKIQIFKETFQIRQKQSI